ncbi:MAG: hypothetical protein HYX75_06690 [Acidobacteria bacterium]|nr:hypothetical protein [Acidobacteriota bacterium]
MSSIGGMEGLQPILERANKVIDEVPQNLKNFDDVLSKLEQSQQTSQPAKLDVDQVTMSAGKTDPSMKVSEISADKAKIAQTPEGIKKLGNEIEHNYNRLNELVHDLQSGRSYNTQELLGIQGEMHDLTLQIEVTTKVVSEAVSGLKQLMQQQV